MAETPRNSFPAIQKSADLAGDRVPQAKTSEGVEDFGRLDGHQIDQLVQSLRRLSTRQLNELILALHEVVAEVAVSKEDADAKMPMPQVPLSVSRQSVSVQASAARPQLSDNHAPTFWRSGLVLLSACVAFGIAVGIVLFLAQKSLVVPLKNVAAGSRVGQAQPEPAATLIPRVTIASNGDPDAAALEHKSDEVVSRADSTTLGASPLPLSPLVNVKSALSVNTDLPVRADTIEPADVSNMVTVETEPAARTQPSTEVANGSSTASIRPVSGRLAQAAESSSPGSELQPSAKPQMVDPTGVASGSDDHLQTVETAPATLSNSANQGAEGTIAVNDIGDGLRQATHASADLVSRDEVEFLLKRGDQYLETGDVATARRFYERAADAGSQKGATGVGKTYDPLFLAQIGVRGLRGGVELASFWYQKASAAGDREAKARLDALLSTPAQ